MIDLYLILFIISITYGINYILPVAYVNNCRGIFTFNSPPCVIVLSILSSNAYLHLYIFYAVGVYLASKCFKYVKSNISIKNDVSRFTVRDINN